MDETPQTRGFENLYSSPNILRMIKSRKMTWARQVARIEEDRGTDRVLVGEPKGLRFSTSFAQNIIFFLSYSALYPTSPL